MSRFLHIFLFASILFAVFMALPNLMWFNGVANVVMISVLQGIFYGFFMALFVTIFSNSALVKKSATPPFELGEQIIHEGPANHFKGWEGVGGRLYLTNQRLIFKSHAFNFQNHTFSLPLHQIQDARPALTIGLISNGLQIATKDGRMENFVVEDRDNWVSKIVSVS